MRIAGLVAICALLLVSGAHTFDLSDVEHLGIGKIVRRGNEPHPFRADPDMEIGGFRLHHVYSHFPNHKHEIHHFEVPQEDKAHKLKIKQFSTRKAKIQMLVKMNEQAYWPEDRDIAGDTTETAYRVGINTNIQNELLPRYNSTSVFLGTNDVNNDRATQVGVHALIYKSYTSSEVVIVFQGSYSDADWIVNAVWWKNYFVERLSEKGRDKWEGLGHARSELFKENKWANQYRRAAVDAYTVAKRDSITSGLEPSGINSATLHGELYFAVARKIVLDAVYGNPGGDFTLTGHSLGGALASMVSAWINVQNDWIYDTPVFGAPGTQCLGRLNFGKYIYPERVYRQITNYVNDYDIITLIDDHPGRVCSHGLPAKDPANPAEEHPGIKACRNVFGRGLSLLVNLRDTQASDDFSTCRYHTHSIYQFYRDYVENPVINDAGETGQCGVSEPQTDCQWAPIGFYFAFIFIHIMVITMIFIFVLLCIRKCCLRMCGKQVRLMPCDCCYGDTDLEEGEAAGKANTVHPETDGVPLNEYPS